MVHPYDRNVRLTQVIAGLMWGRFFIPVLALFYVASQVTLAQFGIIFGVFYGVIMLLEVPSGAIADRIGRKNALLIGRLSYVIEISIMAFMDGFWPMLVANIFSGIGVGFTSGTTESLLFDSLRARRQQKGYARELGLMHMVAKVSMAFVFVIGAWLFSLDPKLPAIISIPVVGAGFLLTFALREPPATRGTHSFLHHIGSGVRGFFRHRELRTLFLLAIPLTALVAISLNLSSVYLERIKYPVVAIGFVAFANSLFAAFAGKHAHQVIAKYGLDGTRLIVTGVILTCIAMMGFLWPILGVVPFIATFMAGVVFSVYASDVVNARVKRDRTTMLSIQNMADNVGLVLLMPLSGALGAWSFSWMWLVLSAIGAIWVLIVLMSR